MTDEDKFRAVYDRFSGVDARLDRHEKRLREIEIYQTGADRDHKHLDSKFAELKKHFDDEIRSIKRPLNTVIIAIVLALLGGFMTFVMQGGLNAAG